MYKSLCPTCEYNATHGKPIVYDCPHCRVRYWNNCSPRQVRSGQILTALQKKHYGNIEWVKAYNPDGLFSTNGNAMKVTTRRISTDAGSPRTDKS